jgi:lipopolysaccharide/colanic/teichoic acid biosynthesis glycosyltransferase
MSIESATPVNESAARPGRVAEWVGRPSSRPPLWSAGVKTAADSLTALAVLLLTSPVVAVAALLVRLTSRGPAFYTQTRLGRGRRPFTIYKIRTMYHDCERHGGARWATTNDPRVTPLGRVLRRLHIDELPQLLNVVCGDMSLVGPRPERPELVPGLEAVMPRYGERLEVKPGMTGLAQIQLPPDSDLESVRRKLACDLYYVRNQSWSLDVRILACTAFYVTGVPFAFAGKLLNVPSVGALERVVAAEVGDEEDVVLQVQSA